MYLREYNCYYKMSHFQFHLFDYIHCITCICLNVNSITPKATVIVITQFLFFPHHQLSLIFITPIISTLPLCIILIIKEPIELAEVWWSSCTLIQVSW